MANKTSVRRLIKTLDTTSPNKGRWVDAAIKAVNDGADGGDRQFGQLRKELNAAGPTSKEYYRGTTTYLHEMAKTGDHRTALNAACKEAGILPPPEDRGSINRLVDRARTARRHHGRKSSGGGLRKVWHELNKPRRR